MSLEYSMHSVNISDFEINKRDETKCYLRLRWQEALSTACQHTEDKVCWQCCAVSVDLKWLSSEPPNSFPTQCRRAQPSFHRPMQNLCRGAGSGWATEDAAPLTPALKYVKKEGTRKKWVQETILNKGEKKKIHLWKLKNCNTIRRENH